MRGKLTFSRILIAVVLLAFIAGFEVFLLSGATTNKGTTGAIGAEYQKIVAAEKTSCTEYGHYGKVATLRDEGLLHFRPIYNSVVYLPGPHCGSFVVGSSAYESSAG